MGVVVKRWDRLHENDPYFPTGYSLQANRVVSGRADLQYEMEKKGHTFEVEHDYLKLKGSRARYCHDCKKVTWGSPWPVFCDDCGNELGPKRMRNG